MDSSRIKNLATGVRDALRFMDANGYMPTPVVAPKESQTQLAVLADVGHAKTLST